MDELESAAASSYCKSNFGVMVIYAHGTIRSPVRSAHTDRGIVK